MKFLQILSASTLSIAGLSCQLNAVVSLNFNAPGLVHGQIIDDEFSAQGVTVSATGSAGIAVLYDSRINNGEDPDLEGPNQIGLGSTSGTWEGGNLTNGSALSSLQTGVGHVLMIQEAGSGDGTGPESTITPGVVDHPDDGTSGTIALDFATGIVDFRLDWIDLDETGLSGYSFRITDNSQGGAALVTSISFDDITNPLSGLYDSTVNWSGGSKPGDDFANRFPKITVDMINTEKGTSLNQIDKLEVVFGGSGGFTNVEVTEVPEPSAYALIFSMIAFLAVGLRRNCR